MKRLFALILAMCMLLAITACDSNVSTGERPTELTKPREIFQFTLSSNGASYSVTGTTFDYIGTDIVVIPNVYNDLPVTSIGEFAFSGIINPNLTNLTSITIPNGVTTIGEGAFRGCKGLTSITIPDSVTTIDGNVFLGCTSLAEIWVGNNPAYSSGQRGVLFNKSKTILYIAPQTISGSYTIPDSVTTIDDEAFWGCISLTSITIPDGVTTIGKYAYRSCKGLTSITIPDSVTTIDEGAFEVCTGLTSIIIPDSVTTIGDIAFSDCSSLTSITYDGTTEQWNNIERGVLWNNSVPATEVICSNGTVSLSN